MSEKRSQREIFDVFIIGGGINGCGIARDAAGRGLKVGLAEMGDLASATSSASTKLFHGGLRYLEYFELRLVREALIEREVLLQAMPHISWPMRFVLPYHPDMRFDRQTPASRLLGWTMPWTRGQRPSWMIRSGLFMYDHLGGRKILPGTTSVDLRNDPAGVPINDKFTKAYEYSDCWVEDARLVVLNARDAEARGAHIMVRTKVTRAVRDAGVWKITLQNSETGASRQVQASMLVNAAGPWVKDVLEEIAHADTRESVRLVRGSHIVTRKLFDHDKCYFFQGPDGRIVFAIPYESDFTLIGTTDLEHDRADTKPVCTEEEKAYLIQLASDYFKRPITEEDVVWTYSGVRPLYDDGASSATAATRDYVLKVDSDGDAPLLSIFGGKITTYRKLAEAALEKISAHVPGATGKWTAGAPLPGGNFPVDGVPALIAKAQADYPFLDAAWAKRLVRAYGTELWQVLGDAVELSDLGVLFGYNLTEREVAWLMDKEFARTTDDVLWRRSKLGLRLDAEQVAALDKFMKGVRGGAPDAA
ncbi:glycerol-3-phosphate dehydrogenase [Aliiruegeria lutimaris]|uniref:Glycerol-3-phosphate dehydrogenase n=1 Tax=Aliiruegeria lutimaris TaxID=571298 RepID=A0A1G8M3K9_9RHOB|nr:glycerol-3-phosphate dehydrogenase [Aliiruegeria lutimaris]SDI62377.1 homodimeric glycerol 3-phosphate dehydrogenase (quinone) [Aliiruegeria lutimaris]